MIQIRPVTDLRYKFSEVEAATKNGPVFLTKNGYGSLVVMDLNQYAQLTNNIDILLQEAARESKETDIRFTGEEVFERLRDRYAGEK